MSARRHAARARRAAAPALLAALLAGAAGAAAAQGSDAAQAFAVLLNRQRTQGAACPGAASRPVPALALQPLLAQVEGEGAEALQRALAAAGLQTAELQLLQVSGPESALAALDFLWPRHCALLASTDFTLLGVRQEARRWRIVLARPLLAPDLGDWRQAGRRVLELSNAARAAARSCGGERFAAAPPLRWSEGLAAAAQAHSRDMAQRDYFEHRSPEGAQAGERARQQGVAWQRIGENIARGPGSAAQVVQGWLDSPGHCRTLMDPAFTEMGAAYALQPRREGGIYWTQVFSRPR